MRAHAFVTSSKMRILEPYLNSRSTTAASEKLVRIIIHMVLNDDFYDWIRGLNLLIIIQMMHAFILRYPHSS